MRTLFDELWDPTTPVPRVFAPSCEVEDTEASYLVAFDLPGVKKEDLKISVKDAELSISGERREERAGKTPFYSERAYGRFSRSLRLPPGVDGDRVEAEYRDGVLRIVVPKPERAKAREIRVA